MLHTEVAATKRPDFIQDRSNPCSFYMLHLLFLCPPIHSSPPLHPLEIATLTHFTLFQLFISNHPSSVSLSFPFNLLLLAISHYNFLLSLPSYLLPYLLARPLSPLALPPLCVCCRFSPAASGIIRPPTSV